ncbi:unnamed protein product [Acanthocheilonema viteae]|uniref:Uncharacterized protein n=1 Tax=Acanthocheilonema viteae TaxID=6277 RepID=A0A498SG52_ACAVI|nr:unnamed protein product [Acanthocheilonema viteae]
MLSEETVTRQQQISGQGWKSGRSGGGEEEGREGLEGSSDDAPTPGGESEFWRDICSMNDSVPLSDIGRLLFTEAAAPTACLDDMPAALCTGCRMTTAFMDAARIPQCFSVLPDNNAFCDQASIRSAPYDHRSHHSLETNRAPSHPPILRKAEIYGNETCSPVLLQCREEYTKSEWEKMFSISKSSKILMTPKEKKCFYLNKATYDFLERYVVITDLSEGLHDISYYIIRNNLLDANVLLKLLHMKLSLTDMATQPFA